MPSVLLHLALGAFLVTAAFRPRLTWPAMGAFAVAAALPDFDALTVHRATLHNVFLPLVLAGAYIAIRRKRLLGPPLLQVYAICVALVGLHIFFDTCYSSTFLFYPVSGEGVHLGFWLGATDGGLSLEMDPLLEGSTQALSGTPTTLVYVVTPSPGVRVPLIESGYDFAVVTFAAVVLGLRWRGERLDGRGSEDTTRVGRGRTVGGDKGA